MIYNAEQYIHIFDIELSKQNKYPRNIFSQNNVFLYRTKIIKSGDTLEYEIYPIWNCRNEVRKAKNNISSEAVQKINEKNAKLKFSRKVNANFTENDLIIHLTYINEPETFAEALHYLENYLRRLRRYRKKHNLSELKYLAVTEGEDGKRFHHHVYISGMDRDEAEKLWKKRKENGRANTRRLQPDENGLAALSEYVQKSTKKIKNKIKHKRWTSSKNLIEPEIKYFDNKIKKKQIEKLAKDAELYAAELFDKLNPDYEMKEIKIHKSDIVDGTYIYARLKHIPPKIDKKKRKNKKE